MAVVLLDTNGHGESANMERNRYRHLIHLLSEDAADPPTVLSSVPAPSRAGIIVSGKWGFVNFYRNPEEISGLDRIDPRDYNRNRKGRCDKRSAPRFKVSYKQTTVTVQGGGRPV